MSHALSTKLTVGSVVQGRLRRSDAFASPASDRPVILIANGVGIAPFLGLLRERGAGAPTWMIYGERDAEHDAALLPELTQAQHDGALQRLDLAWSRSEPRAYVQDRLREQLTLLREWLQREATLMVCGSPEMGAAVEQLLLDALGDAEVEALRDAGRYRRELF
jgi:sulfite reductase (NADPH) flavoprotein alpha-component